MRESTSLNNRISFKTELNRAGLHTRQMSKNDLDNDKTIKNSRRRTIMLAGGIAGNFGSTMSNINMQVIQNSQMEILDQEYSRLFNTKSTARLS